MERLMADAGERLRLGARAREAAERFGLEKITERWEELLQRVAQTPKGSTNNGGQILMNDNAR